MPNLDELRHNLKCQLQELSGSISDFKNDPKYLGLFDEFLREHEFGLALETLCDFLLEPKTPLVSESLLEQIKNLHQLMNVEDACVQNLREKAIQSKSV